MKILWETCMTWQRLLARAGQESQADIGPFEGIPDHLSQPLMYWLVKNLRGSSAFMLSVANELVYDGRMCLTKGCPIRPLLRLGTQRVAVTELTEGASMSPGC